MSKGIVQTVAAALLLAGAPIIVEASEDSEMSDIQSWANEHPGGARSGSSELWVDPTGNDAETSDATLQVGADGIRYAWSYRGKPQAGEFHWHDDGVTWQDSWHQPEAVQLSPVTGHGALHAAEYSYPAGTGPDWHWRIKLAARPDGSSVVQMVNIAPWSEEARAVRLVLGKSQ